MGARSFGQFSRIKPFRFPFRHNQWFYSSSSIPIKQIYEYASPAKVEKEIAAFKKWNKVTAISPSIRKTIVEDLGWDQPTDIQKQIFKLCQKDRSVS